MQNFIYIPADGYSGTMARWINLALVAQIIEMPDGNLGIWDSVGNQIESLSGKQAAHLRAALSPAPKLPVIPVARQFENHYERRAFVGGISDSEYFDHHTEVGA